MYSKHNITFKFPHIQMTQANNNRQEQPEASEQPPVKDNHSEIEQRLLLIPIVFILLRIWGTIQFFFSIATSGHNQHGCIPYAMHTTYFVLGILQVTWVRVNCAIS